MKSFKVIIFLFFSLYLKVSSSSSVTNTFTIPTSTGSENFTSEETTSDRTETTANTSTGDNSTYFPVTSNGLNSTNNSMHSTATTASSKGSLGPTLEEQPTPTPTTSGTSSLSVLAFAVIILILILVIIVVILVSVISLRFKCQEAPPDTSKARNEAPSESSQVNGEKESITLVSMRSLYTEAGGQESSMQGNLQNDSNEVDETRNNFTK